MGAHRGSCDACTERRGCRHPLAVAPPTGPARRCPAAAAHLPMMHDRKPHPLCPSCRLQSAVAEQRHQRTRMRSTGGHAFQAGCRTSKARAGVRQLARIKPGPRAPPGAGPACSPAGSSGLAHLLQHGGQLSQYGGEGRALRVVVRHAAAHQVLRGRRGDDESMGRVKVLPARAAKATGSTWALQAAGGRRRAAAPGSPCCAAHPARRAWKPGGQSPASGASCCSSAVLACTIWGRR